MNTPDERLVFVDLETAGVEPWRPVIQLAAIATTSEGRELETFEAKVRFSAKFANPKSLNKNSYSREQWKSEARPSREVATQLAAMLARHATIDQAANSGRVFQVAQLVAHNATYDSAFLQAWFGRLGLFLPASFRVLCTMQRAIWLFHENKNLTPPDDYKLSTLCQYFGISLQPHDALNDVRATAALYREMTKVAERPSALAA